jgi:DNA polymerase-3 subunit gamma/tau
MTDALPQESRPGYVVLARKYRPRRFSEVAGQQGTVQTLQNALRSGRLAHAFLFSGPRGVGKTTVARLLARALNCQKGVAPEPCGECDACREVAEGRALDVLEIDGASNNKVEEARQLRETVRYAPARDRFRVFIIDEVHMLSVAAFNALLKTLEEPPAHIKFIFATTEAHKIPATILSRCQHYEFRRLTRDEIQAQLAEVSKREGLSADDKALGLIARAAGGSLRDALSALDQVVARSGSSLGEADARSVLGLIPHDRVLGVFEAAATRDLPALLAIARDLFAEGCDPARFCEEVLAQARDLLVQKLSAQAEAHGDWVGVADAEERRRLAAAFTPEQLVRLFNLFFDLEQRLRGASLPQVLLEVVCVKLIHLADLTPIEEILRRLQGGGRPGADLPARGAGASATAELAAASQASTSPAPSTGAAAPAAPAAADAAGPLAAEEEDAAPAPEGTVEAEPAPAVSAAPAAADSLRERFLARVRERKVALASFLEHARRIEQDGNTLVVSFLENHSFFHDKAAQSLPLLQEAARELLGKEARVRLLRQEAGDEEIQAMAEKNGAEIRRSNLMDKVVQEPIVQSALEIFGGQIVDVQES